MLPLLLLLLSGCSPGQGPPPQARNGVLDLRGWDFAAGGPVRMNGAWEFYWQRLLSGQEFAGLPPPPKSGLIPVPGVWNALEIDGRPVDGVGFATYRLRVLVTPGAMEEGLAAIRMPPPVNTAHILHVNGEQVGGAGQMSRSPEESRAAYAPYIALLPPSDGQFEVIIHISNHLHASGGLMEAPVFGHHAQVVEQFQLQAGRNLFLLGAIAVMGIYHLTLFSLRRRERAYLYFGLFCLAVAAVLTSLLHPVLFARVVSPAWPLLPRTGVFLSACVALLLLAFTHALFPRESKRIWRGLVAAPALLFLALAYPLPIQLLTALLGPFAFTLTAVTLFTLGVVLRAVLRRRAGARIVLLGYLPLLGAIVNDGLFFSGQIQTESLVAVGLTLYVFAQAYLLSVRFAQAFTQAEALSDELGRNNASLRQAQQELARSEAEYRAIFEESRDLIVVLNAEGTIQTANGASRELLGYRPEEMAMTQPEDFFAHPEECERLLNALAQSGTVSNFAAQLRHQDGRLIPCLISASQRQERNDQPPGYQAVVHNMTDYLQAEAERARAQQLLQEKAAAEAASQAKSRFLATMTHELRTPLNSILGYAQILQSQNALSDVQSRGVTTILSSGRHLLNLIEDVLDLARIEADRLPIVHSGVDLAGLLADVLDAVRVEAEQKGLALNARLSPDLPPRIVTDEKRLRQILLNLLSNAIRYTPQGEVALHVTPLPIPPNESETRLRFAVTDTGVGLAPEEMARIFAPFEQAAEPGRSGPGVGLGLSISQRLAHLLGSRIHVESAPGVGSRFWFDLPAAWEDDDARPAPARRAAVQPPLPSQEPTPRPPDEVLEPLYRLGRLGDMRGVEAAARQLAEEHPTHAAFAGQVLKLAQAFDDRGICTLTEPRNLSDNDQP